MTTAPPTPEATALCGAVHPHDERLPDPIPEGWHTYRRVCVLPAGHEPLADGLGAHASAQADRWDDAAPPAPKLAALPATLVHDGQLDLDAMRTRAPQVRDDLRAALRHAATLARHARGTVVTPEDTYPLVRRLTEADEVLDQWSRAFADAAAEARALIEEEALSVPGAEADGTLTAGLYVPDGEGRRIAVRADWKAGESTWDVSSLVGWLVDDEVADWRGAAGLGPEPAMRASIPEEEVRGIARNVVDRLLALGRYSPHAAKVKALRTRLAERGRDDEAAVIAQVRHVGPRTYLGVKVTREDAPGAGA